MELLLATTFSCVVLFASSASGLPMDEANAAVDAATRGLDPEQAARVPWIFVRYQKRG